MQNIVPVVNRKLITSELTKEKFVRKTNFGVNDVFIITAHDSPNTMREIGRLREISFRDAGGGTGKSLDIDEFDTRPNPYKQLIVWNPYQQEIVGGYRFFKLKEAEMDKDNKYNLATSHIFEFSGKFINEYFPCTMELGRSFVQPRFQPKKNYRKGIFSLDNLWDGLGSLIVDNKDIKYFFGKITIYLNFDQKARDMILYFLFRYFPDNENLVKPYKSRGIKTDISEISSVFKGNSFKEDYKILIKAIRSINSQIPPLINAYMNLSPTMKTFGSSVNPLFGDVEEIGILVSIPDIYHSKKNRHIATYMNSNYKTD